ncbi:hypothetical protein DRP53_10515 [candidate division WOR-3 bacterium]|uniref:HTH luxR-type domain-containing protein n=1 Tax=candidate division WOR-3 bacterium TaxID=2052148 RepID=A0A660SCN5_UNCW3|nr:MAG: hypothetical protein DRP53_10515 [candidate division WOR-3 bacterium]
MVLILLKSQEFLRDKSPGYILTYCWRKAIRNIFKGKCISLPKRSRIRFADWQAVREAIPDRRPGPAERAFHRLLLRKIREILTEREWMVCVLLSEGYNQTEIAERLGITQQMVSKMVRKIREKAQLFNPDSLTFTKG